MFLRTQFCNIIILGTSTSRCWTALKPVGLHKGLPSLVTERCFQMQAHWRVNPIRRQKKLKSFQITLTLTNNNSLLQYQLGRAERAWQDNTINIEECCKLCCSVPHVQSPGTAVSSISKKNRLLLLLYQVNYRWEKSTGAYLQMSVGYYPWREAITY